MVRIILPIIVSILIVGTLGAMAYAAGDKNGQPFEALWDAIHDLQIQIDTIELTPGPTGATGPPGATGATGPAGSSSGTLPQAIFTPLVVSGDPLIQTLILEKDGVVDVDASILPQSLTSSCGYALYVDDVEKTRSFLAISEPRDTGSLHLSWAGNLPAGEHTIEVKNAPGYNCGLIFQVPWSYIDTVLFQ